jgi:hypothetical protein
MYPRRVVTRVGLAAVATALAVACLPGQAHAQGDASSGAMTCQVLPGQVVTAQTESLVSDTRNGPSWDPLWLLDTRQTLLLMDFDVICRGVDGASPGIGTFEGQYNIVGDGTMSTVVCGSGHVSETEFWLTGFGNTVLLGRFGLVYAGTVGKLTISNLDGVVTLGTSAAPTSDQDVDGGGGSGVLQLTPTVPDGGNCLLDDVETWFVNGGFAATFHGN